MPDPYRRPISVSTVLGSAVRNLRTARGWSRPELSDRCGLSTAVIDGVERDKRHCSLLEAADLAMAFGSTVPDLLASSRVDVDALTASRVAAFGVAGRVRAPRRVGTSRTDRVLEDRIMLRLGGWRRAEVRDVTWRIFSVSVAEAVARIADERARSGRGSSLEARRMAVDVLVGDLRANGRGS